MYNLNYTPTTVGIQSWREILSGDTRTKTVRDLGLEKEGASTSNNAMDCYSDL
jgi:hypothetical protein